MAQYLQVRDATGVDRNVQASINGGLMIRDATGVDRQCIHGQVRDATGVDRTFWLPETQVYPGVGMNYFNTGTYQSYGTCTNNGSVVHIDTFGGTHTGGIVCYIGPFNAVGKTKIMFNLTRTYTIDLQHHFVIGLATNNQSNSTSAWQVLNTTSWGATGNVTWTKSNVWSIVNPSSSMWLGVAQTSSDNYSGHTLVTDVTGIWLAP